METQQRKKTKTDRNFYFRIKDTLEQIDINEIIYLEANLNYTVFKTQNQSFISSFTLRIFQDKLPDNQFVRVNRGHLINLLALDDLAYDATKNYLELKNGERLKISRRRKAEVEKTLVDFRL